MKTQNSTGIKWNRIAAIAAWLLSVLFTAMFLRSAGELGLVLAFGIGLIVQLILTIAERPLWRWIFKRSGGNAAPMAFAITLVDGGLNAAGIYPMVPRLTKTGIGLMLIDAFELSPDIGRFTAFVVAMFVGTVVAGLAEYLWEIE